MLEQQEYLMEIFRDKKEFPRIVLREILEDRFEVLKGWLYVDALIRFFEDGITLTEEIRTLFPNAFDEAEANADLKEKKKKSTIRIEDLTFTKLDKCTDFSDFVDKTDINVAFSR